MKKLILLLSIILFGNTKACSWYDPDYEYFNLFTQGIIKDKSYLPFLLTFSNRFYGHEHFEIPDESIESWQQYFGKTLNYTDTKNLVEQLPMSELNLFKKGNSANLILKKLGSYQKYSEGIDYLIEAKYLEPFMRINYVESPNSFYYSASENTKNATQLDYTKTISALILLYKSVENREIKMRYGFQIVRFNHYTRNYSKSEEAFRNYVEPLKSRSAPYFMALDQLAGAQSGLSNGTEANWNFFKVFMNNKSRKESAFVSMKLSDSASFNNVLKRAQTPEEKNMAYFLLAYEDFNDPIPMMEKMFEIDPNSEILKVLAARSVNELERDFLPTYYNQKDTNNLNQNFKDNSEKKENVSGKQDNSSVKKVGFWQRFINFFKNIFSSDKSKTENKKTTDDDGELLNNSNRIPFFSANNNLYSDEPSENFLNDFENLTSKIKEKSTDEFWQITSAYLSFLKKDYTKSEEILKEIKTTNPEYLTQINRMKMLNEIVSQPKINADFENKMMTDYASFFNAPKVINTEDYGDLPDTKEFIRDILANRYFLQGEDGKAFLMNNQLSDLQYNPNSKLVKKVEDFYRKPNKNSFEKYIAENLNNVGNTDAFFNVIYGDFAMRQADFIKAKNFYEKAQNFSGIPRVIYDWSENTRTESPLQFNDKEYDGFNNISDLIFGHNVWESFESTENESMEAENITDFPFIKNKMNKLQLAANAIQLYKIAQGNSEKSALANKLLGNLLYNTSILGYYRQTFVMDIDNENGPKFQFGTSQNTFQYYYKNFTDVSFIEPDNFDLAISYYKKALSLSKDKESQAQILFQMASAEQGKYYQYESKNRKVTDYSDKDYQAKSEAEQLQLDQLKNSQYRSSFANLKKNYGDTKTFQNLQSTCLYFQYYLSK
ncbi:hypothetical protein [Halpernia frigidisoli]|uniref:Tetratricopeptide repeat protein n=1 Tax=Halpernia frigidisoli TaxID=1125876 RepID=A0A1I3FZ64_9FLAO|nr:hypothetical protein [Halpernia frigidisoli]SFI16520.1 hypothetical protein SAMN05443292_1730 [Halpernia frigidisoli]